MNVIVAVPRQDDAVWKVSSEKVPHMTLLALGDLTGDDQEQVALFLQHAVDTSLNRFGMEVDRRGTLGPLDADVLFFSTRYVGKQLREFRDELLHFNPIKNAYNTVDQYDSWTPHLTLGYPTAPAKELPNDQPLYWVSFDKIALWVGDEDAVGPEFVIPEPEGDLALAMSTDRLSNVLSHHGVKGMKWGVRHDRPGKDVPVSGRAHRKAQANSPDVTIETKGKKIKTTGGKGHDIHPDAASALRKKQQAKASGVHTLSNADLKALNERLNLEQQYQRMATPGKGEAQKFVEQQLRSVGQQQLQSVIQKQAKK